MPETETTPPYMYRGFRIDSYRQHETRQGLAFSCTLWENDVLIGHADNDGWGGSCVISFRRPEARNRFSTAAAAYTLNSHDEPEDTFVHALISAFENDEIAKRDTLCRMSTVNPLGLHDEMQFPGQTGPERYAELRAAYPNLTHVWMAGQGWTPVEDRP